MKKTKVLVALIIAGIAVVGITTWSMFNKTNRKVISEVPENTEKSQINEQKQEVKDSVAKDEKEKKRKDEIIQIDKELKNNQHEKKESEKSKLNIDNNIKNDSKENSSDNTNIKYIYLGEHSNKSKENIAIEETINNSNNEISKNNSNKDTGNSTKVLSSTDRMNNIKEIIDIINIHNSDDNNDSNKKINDKKDNNTSKTYEEKSIDSISDSDSKTSDIKEDNTNSSNIVVDNNATNETIERAKEVIQNTKGKPLKERPSFVVVDPSKTNKGNGKSLVKPTDGKSNTTQEAKKDNNVSKENKDKTKIQTVNDAPVLIADETTTLPYGSHWKLSDSNVKAYDNVDGDLHVRVAHIDVRAKVPGTYHVTLEAKNSRGKITRKTITVNILPGAPTIKAHDVTITEGTEFTDSLVRLRVEDCKRRNLINVTKREGNVDTNKVGTYPLTYTVTDDYGLSCTKTVIVTVKAKEVQNSTKNLETSNNAITNILP